MTRVRTMPYQLQLLQIVTGYGVPFLARQTGSNSIYGPSMTAAEVLMKKQEEVVSRSESVSENLVNCESQLQCRYRLFT